MELMVAGEDLTKIHYQFHPDDSSYLRKSVIRRFAAGTGASPSADRLRAARPGSANRAARHAPSTLRVSRLSGAGGEGGSGPASASRPGNTQVRDQGTQKSIQAQ